MLASTWWKHLYNVTSLVEPTKKYWFREEDAKLMTEEEVVGETMRRGNGTN
jgi:hypothetical protein